MSDLQSLPPLPEPFAQDPEPSTIAASFRRRRQTEDRALMMTFMDAAQSNPDLAGEARELGIELGLHPRLVEDNIDQIRGVMQQRTIQRLTFARESPILLQQMVDPDFARIAHDQVKELSGIEGLLGNLEAGQLTIEQGMIAERIFSAEGEPAQADVRRLEQVRRRLEELPSRSSDIFTGLFKTVGMGSMMVDTAFQGMLSGATGGMVMGAPVQGVGAGPGSVTGALVGGTMGLWSAARRAEAGNAYLEMLDKGVDETTAARVAPVVGFVNATLEVGGFTALTAPVRQAIQRSLRAKISDALIEPTTIQAAKNFAKTWAAGVGAEMGTETAQEISNIIGEVAAGADPGDIGERIGDILGETLRGVALLGSIPAAVQLHSDLRDVQVAQQQAAIFEEVVEAVRASKVTQRSPKAMASFVDRGVEGTVAETVYLDAQEVSQVLEQAGVTQQQLQNQLPQIARQIDEAVATQGDIVISTGEFTTQIAPTEVGPALMQHARFDPNAPSAAELPEIEARIEELQGQLPDEVERALTFNQEAAEVEEAFRQQVAGTGRASPREARAAAAVYRAFVETLAPSIRGEEVEAGVSRTLSPKQFEEQFPLRVERSAEAQEARETAEQRPQERGEQTRTAPRARFVPETLTIQLAERADITSVLHEMAHAFLHIYAQLVSQPNAPPLAIQQMQAFLEWRGIDGGLDAWNSMSLGEQRPHHEAFAESFEVYAMEGRAPSLELQGLFDRFARWIRRLWKNFLGEVEDLDPTIRGIFDRMLASEEAIEQTQAVRGMTPLFESREQSGLSEEEWETYQQQRQADVDAAVAEVQRRSLRSMQHTSQAQDKEVRALHAERDRIREELQAEERSKVESEPVYRALRFLRGGTFITESGTEVEFEGNHKMHTDSVRALVSEEIDLRSLAVTHPEGMAPDIVAEMFGYESGKELVDALIGREPIESVVSERTDARMLAEHGELLDPRSIQGAVDLALHNDVRARFLAAELQVLMKATRPVRVMVASAREAARRFLSSMPASQIKSWRFAAAERRANREAFQASKKGDTEQAIISKRAELLQHEMAREAALVEDEISNIQRRFQRFFDPDEKVGKRRNIDLVNAGRAVLAWHAFEGSEASNPFIYLEEMKQYAPEMEVEVREIVVRLTEDRAEWRQMPLEELRLLDDGLDALWSRALRERQILVDGKLQSRDSIVDVLLPILASKGPPGRGGPPGRLMTPGERRKVNFKSWKSWIRHVESWAIEMDGGSPGPVHRHLFALLREPFDSYQLEKDKIVRPMSEVIRKLKLKDTQKIQAGKEGEIAHTFADKRELIGALLHSGNLSNLRKLLLGYGWVPEPEARGGPIQTQMWWKFINRMIDEGVITKADLDFVQGVWDIFEELFPRSQRVHLDLYGRRAEAVNAQSFETKHGTYRGGYYPAEIDRVEARARGNPLPDTGDDLIETSREQRHRMPSTGRDFMMTRTDSTRPLRLDLRLIASSIDDELRFIHLQSPGRDVLRLLQDDRLGPAIDVVDPGAREVMFMPWLRDTLQNRVMKSSGNPSMDHFLAGVRRNVGVAIMFANARVALQQVTGLGNSKQHVPLQFLRAGMKAFFSQRPREAVAQVTGQSEFMKTRIDLAAGQITDDADVLLGPAWLGNLQKWTQKHGFFAQRVLQIPVDIITWIGAHEHAVSQGKSEREAVRHADAIVRRSQASGLAPDISRFERSSAYVRLLTQFSTFWLATLNMILERKGSDRIKAIGTVLAVVGLGGAAIAKVLEGGWEDDDDDGSMWDDVASWAFAETAQTAFSILPPPTSALMPAVTGRFGGRINFGAAFSTAERSLKTFRDAYQLTFDEGRDLRSSDVRDAATLLSLILGLPITAVARPIQYQIDRQEDADAVEQIRGMVTGR